MAEKRKDSKGRILRDGENQMKDGRYRYQYMDGRGKRCAVYSWKLVETDRTPPGKRDGISLREKIKQIDRDVEDGIKAAANNKITLNDMFDLCENETNIKVIQEIMGHSDISTTMNIYAEATESKKKESFEKLQGKIKIC